MKIGPAFLSVGFWGNVVIWSKAPFPPNVLPFVVHSSKTFAYQITHYFWYNLFVFSSSYINPDILVT